MDDEHASLSPERKKCTNPRISVCGVRRRFDLWTLKKGSIQMRNRLLILMMAAVLVASPLKAQTKTWSPLRLPDGLPDLQGFWTNATYTPLERPKGVTKPFYTREEAIEIDRKRTRLKSRHIPLSR